MSFYHTPGTGICQAPEKVRSGLLFGNLSKKTGKTGASCGKIMKKRGKRGGKGIEKIHPLSYSTGR
ncbi:MAG: hypothetical protein L6W00_24730 [Lentisphaeria bacterium]|nr:MAG: hypothetical protein L6W00_24730 [Lentisphaeria bacterium]